MRSAALYIGPDFVGDRWQHFRLQLRLNVVNLEYLTIHTYIHTYISVVLLEWRRIIFGLTWLPVHTLDD